MEGSLGDSKQVEHAFLTNLFEEWCPFYMSIGMTYKEFWEDDVMLAKTYLKAYKLKEERESEKMKWTVWLQGLYIFEALCDVSPILRPFSKAKKPLQYPTMPFGMKEEKQLKIDEEALKKRQDVEKMRAQIYFQNWARSITKQFKGE